MLRVGAVAGADYEWGRHVVSGRAAGLSDGEIRAIRAGRFEDFAPDEQAVLRYAETVERSAVTDDVWQEVAAHFPPASMVELTALACMYGFIARLLLATALDLDPDIQGLEYP
jgi:alkylhydroperoxidase family enzyme